MLRPPIAVRPATVADRATVQATLGRAFIDDPVMRYIFPDAAARPRSLDRFFELVGRAEGDPADTLIAGPGTAVSVWRRPGEWRTPPSAMLRLAWPMLTTFRTALPRALRVQSLLEKHHPAAPHWYLEFAACLPEHHGEGFGGAAIRARLRETDAARVPTALETANPGNRAIYAALGYQITGEFTVTPNLKFWTMWRDPA